MANRCPDCNKFVSLETATDAEVNVDIDDEGRVTGDVRITLECADCGTEMKESSFDIDIEPVDEIVAHVAKFHTAPEGSDVIVEDANFSIDDESSERTTRTEGKGRYARTFYGFSLTLSISCDCGHDVDADGNVIDGPFSCNVSTDDDVQASSMDDCC